MKNLMNVVVNLMNVVRNLEYPSRCDTQSKVFDESRMIHVRYDAL